MVVVIIIIIIVICYGILPIRFSKQLNHKKIYLARGWFKREIFHWMGLIAMKKCNMMVAELYYIKMKHHGKIIKPSIIVIKSELFCCNIKIFLNDQKWLRFVCNLTFFVVIDLQIHQFHNYIYFFSGYVHQ